MSPRKKKATTTPVVAQQDAVVDTPMKDVPAVAEEESTCPGCKPDDGEDLNKDVWIECTSCKTWYHWVCAGIDIEANGNSETPLTPEQVDKWFCQQCVELDPSRIMTLKPPPRKSTRIKAIADTSVSDMPMLEGDSTATTAGATTTTVPPTTTPVMNHNGVSTPHGTPELNKWIAIADAKKYSPDHFQRMKGSDLGLEWTLRDENAMKEPIIIETPEGLGMKMPPKETTVRDIANELGPDVPLEVIDVLTQSSCQGWTLGKWADYYHTPPTERDKIRNVISLEVSGTTLGQRVLPPRFVRELDWVEKFWPHNKKQLGHYPKVQLYCLMGVAQSWTDWHIDFAGSSVYYHILNGAKVFYFIKPTAANLAAYEHWSGTDIQNHTWLGDLVDEVVRVELVAGNTMIIPTGWIHAVYTPVDTLVFGGNFLHSLNMKTQLRVRDIEIRTRVPKKFRFPLFTRLCWYVGEKYCKDLKSKEEFPIRILKSIDALATFLVSEARIMERGSEVAKKEAKENVPADRIKDPSLLARELRWRVRSAAGADSDAELGGDGDELVPVKREPGGGRHPGRKRKEEHSTVLFKNWQPPEWNTVEHIPANESHDMIKVEEAGEQGEWMKKEGLTGDVMRTIKRNGVSKLRKLEHGAIERYSVVRTVEIVTPSGASTKKESM